MKTKGLALLLAGTIGISSAGLGLLVYSVYQEFKEIVLYFDNVGRNISEGFNPLYQTTEDAAQLTGNNHIRRH
jgi:hypothetical protein